MTGARNVHEAHHQFDQIAFHEKEMLPFYEHHLKGVDNDVMDDAPVRIFLRGTRAFRQEPEWPLRLADQHPQDAAARARGDQPASTIVSKGWLKASHRETDPVRS